MGSSDENDGGDEEMVRAFFSLAMMSQMRSMTKDADDLLADTEFLVVAAASSEADDASTG